MEFTCSFRAVLADSHTGKALSATAFENWIRVLPATRNPVALATAISKIDPRDMHKPEFIALVAYIEHQLAVAKRRDARIDNL